MNSRGVAAFALGVAIGGTGCHLTMPARTADGQATGAVAAARQHERISGRVEIAAAHAFGPGASAYRVQDPGPAFKVQDAASDRMAEIARGATVSLIRTDNGQTVASAVTDDQGQFVLEFSGFEPVAGQPYLLEAVKGLKMSDSGEPNAVGAAAARLRTLIVWNGGWTSFRNSTPGPLTISIGTTGLSLLVRAAGLDATGQKALVGSLGTGDVFTPPGGSPPVLALAFDSVWGMVRDALASGQDPVAAVALPGLTDLGATAGRTGPPLSVARANPATLESGASITFYGRGFSKVANENVLWIRTFTVENDAAVSAAAVAPDGTWARFDAPAALPVPGPMSRYRIEVRQASGHGQTQYDVPMSVARPAIRPGVLVPLAGDALYGGSWREGTFDRARFWGPSDVHLDPAGNLFVCEHWYGNRIRVLANETGDFFGQTVRAGQVATVVGTGYGADLPRASRWNGDGPVLSTNLSLPWSIALDPAGNLLITDYDAGAKFRVAAKANGSLWGTAVLANRVTTLSITSGSWGARGITTDAAGNLYYYDWGEKVVRFIPTTSGTFWGQAMNANQSYALTDDITSGYNELKLDPAGNLLVVGNNQVRVLAAVAGTYYNQSVPARTLTTVAGTGASAFDGDGKDAVATAIGVYNGVAVDPAGNLYISDAQSHRIRVVAAAAGSVQVPVLGTGGALVPKGGTLKGKVYTVLGTGTPSYSAPGTANTSAHINTTYGIDMDSAGGLYVADYGNQRIVYVATR